MAKGLRVETKRKILIYNAVSLFCLGLVYVGYSQSLVWAYSQRRMVHIQRGPREYPFKEQTLNVTLTDVQAERHRQLRQACSTMESPVLQQARVTTFCFNNSVVFTRVFKCGTAYSIGTLKKLFYGPSVHLGNQEFSWVGRLSAKEAKSYLDGYYSFFFVREPYGRLFSTYSNKFYMPKEHWQVIAPQIIKRYRNNPSETSLKYGHDVTFLEMIRYTVDTYERGQQLDVHVTPMHKLARPCGVNYTYIGKLETFKSDWETMVSHWKANGFIDSSIDISDSAIFGRGKLPEVNHLFKTINVTEHSTIPLYNLFLRTWSYYQIVGKISKHISMPFRQEEIIEVNTTNYKATVTAAVKSSMVYGNELKQQKMAAMLEAYATVPRSLLERLRNMLLTDCTMFGYDDRPAWLFNLTEQRDSFDYLKWI